MSVINGQLDFLGRAVSACRLKLTGFKDQDLVVEGPPLEHKDRLVLEVEVVVTKVDFAEKLNSDGIGMQALKSTYHAFPVGGGVEITAVKRWKDAEETWAQRVREEST